VFGGMLNLAQSIYCSENTVNINVTVRKAACNYHAQNKDDKFLG